MEELVTCDDGKIRCGDRADDPAYRAAEIQSAYKFGALPVVYEGELVGIITVTDFLDRFAEAGPVAKVASREQPG